MQSIHIQRLIALPYFGLGGWCLFAPHMVERMTINPEYQHLSATSALFIGCFGAQAVWAVCSFGLADSRAHRF